MGVLSGWVSGGEAQRAERTDRRGEAARERGRVEQLGDRREVDLPGGLATHAAGEADLAVGKEAARHDADADLGVAQLAGAVVPFGAERAVHLGRVGIETDGLGEAREGAARLKVERPLGGVVAGDAVSPDLEQCGVGDDCGAIGGAAEAQVGGAGSGSLGDVSQVADEEDYCRIAGKRLAARRQSSTAALRA